MFSRSTLAFVASLVLGAPLLAQAPGGTFVLTRQGNHADGNAFSRKEGVFLSGGPVGNCAAPGLADGDYVFQITDPAGQMLLTRDPLFERGVRVQGGVFSQYLGRVRSVGMLGPCGSLNLRLFPFETNTTGYGEYKVWLTRVEDYDPMGGGFFGFDPAKSKSDNFRINPPAPQSIVRGHKFFDHDENGAWQPNVDPLEVPIGGWRVELWRNGLLDGVTFTDQDGGYIFQRDRDGSAYEVREQAPGGFVNDATPGAVWLATTARTGAVATTAEPVVGPEFGNVSYELLEGAGRTVEDWAGRPNNSESFDILCGCDPLWRTALTTRNGLPVNLRNPVSNDNPSASIFTPVMPPASCNGAYANWRAYARKNPHDHAGFLLSREIAATLLSKSCGGLQGSIYVDRFQDGVLVSLEDMLDGAIGLLSETGAGLTGPNDPYQDLRTRMLNCLNEFGTINETGDSAATQVVFARSERPREFAIPY